MYTGKAVNQGSIGGRRSPGKGIICNLGLKLGSCIEYSRKRKEVDS
jgi:hypothetical protein